MGVWLADDASRVSNLTSHFGPGQGSLRSPLRSPSFHRALTPRGHFSSQGHRTDRTGSRHPVHPVNHPLQVLATPWNSPVP